mgnify:FL=1
MPVASIDGTHPAAVWVPIDELEPWGDNPSDNSHSVQNVVHSIKRFGFGAPILARTADKVVIAGHTRLKAAIQLGLDKVPVRYLNLDPAEAKALALADNKLGELASWNDEQLASILRELEVAEVSFDDLGFTENELAELMGSSDLDEEGLFMDEDLVYKVVVDCRDETEQGELIERLEKEGLKCQPLIS